MFCCIKKQSHFGEIVNAICLEEECSKSKNQLCCLNCIEEDHQNHQTNSLKKLMPQLLVCHKEKEKYQNMLTGLLQFVKDNFGDENADGETTILENTAERVKEILTDLKKQVEMNQEEIGKMKAIFKNLNKNTPSTTNMPKSPINSKDTLEHNPLDMFQNKKNPSLAVNSKISVNQGPISPSKLKNMTQLNQNGAIDQFSHNSKHPYLSISSDLKTVSKASHSGHRFAAVCVKALNVKQNEVRVRINRSVSGNIMIGFCHESIVRDRQYANCYGTNMGTYLIGQNSSSEYSAISFHHSINIMNRKQIVGWNFEEGDQILMGINFQEEFIYFKKEISKKGKAKGAQFTMKIKSEDNLKPELQNLIDLGLKLIVLLQSEGDEVTLMD